MALKQKERIVKMRCEGANVAISLDGLKVRNAYTKKGECFCKIKARDPHAAKKEAPDPYIQFMATTIGVQAKICKFALMRYKARKVLPKQSELIHIRFVATSGGGVQELRDLQRGPKRGHCRYLGRCSKGA